MKTHTNFDAGELDKFQALASRWWDPASEFWPLHALNPHRLKWIDQLAGLAGKQVLDVGCGGGILAEAMAHRGATVLGIDLADQGLKVAALHAAQSKASVTFRHIAAEDLAAETPAGFDVVTCMEMLEHVPDPAQVVAACATLVKPGGWVFFSTINRSPLSWLVAILGAEQLLKILPRGTHDFAKFIRPAELKAMATANGLVLGDEKGLRYNPFHKTFRLGKWMGVNYLLALQKPPLEPQGTSA
jgi:2-polyprenyl-6-hydroxyphenyl methylase / 3-demethylubiquinone-9 3-methyltransferase